LALIVDTVSRVGPGKCVFGAARSSPDRLALPSAWLLPSGLLRSVSESVFDHLGRVELTHRDPAHEAMIDRKADAGNETCGV
jgi:hypothetical protein